MTRSTTEPRRRCVWEGRSNFFKNSNIVSQTTEIVVSVVLHNNEPKGSLSSRTKVFIQRIKTFVLREGFEPS